ncbi:MAG: ABC transporter permease, partial [Pedobacter sp.]
MFKLNLKIALRNLWKSKGFTLINVGGLAIGLASCMILLLYVAYEWGYDKQMSNYERTYVVFNNQSTPTEVFTFASTPGLLAQEVKETIPGVEIASRFDYPNEKLIAYNNTSFKKLSTFADAGFLKILGRKVIRGNADKLLLNPNSVVITETLAKTLFGNEDPINKTVKYENIEELKVEGVIEDLPKNSSVQFDYIMPWALYDKLNSWTKEVGWNSNYCMTFIQLKDNSLFNASNDQLKEVFKAHDKETNNQLFLHPIAKWHLYSKFEGG